MAYTEPKKKINWKRITIEPFDRENSLFGMRLIWNLCNMSSKYTVFAYLSNLS